MSDDADHPIPLVRKVFQRRRDDFERRLIQRSETFVEEDRVKPGGACRGECRHLRREREGECEAGLGRLPAGEGSYWTT